MKNIVDILKALSDETRLRIINLLYLKELCVCDIVETLNITQTKASRHLQYLKNAGLVEDRKSAQWVYYSMAEISDIKFLDSLIYENIRTQEPFKSDLDSLEDWLKDRKRVCD
ncbi:MAG: metalloregulator ArsR/SmtB family transcription factor [Syntrophaceticus sp.]|jgi:ArsR family transcriptional regulator|nr:metalloregulator ArsR/SmtB family transcription factor [Syntrophaceticus sp.]MDD3314559.1 metalloregulator ArsR/SmtB family transcription factor [Syntrophaceticus sp.]MDD4359548.1 metalloregulator ArsR/SmtB family transcription factor [Syntrophaceticus sp.]MDD4782372.1 metalloregulator ArsR/SmtB family transcription factor [Syntrophaceticus sp.]